MLSSPLQSGTFKVSNHSLLNPAVRYSWSLLPQCPQQILATIFLQDAWFQYDNSLEVFRCLSPSGEQNPFLIETSNLTDHSKKMKIFWKFGFLKTTVSTVTAIKPKRLIWHKNPKGIKDAEFDCGHFETKRVTVSLKMATLCFKEWRYLKTTVTTVNILRRYCNSNLTFIFKVWISV